MLKELSRSLPQPDAMPSHPSSQPCSIASDVLKKDHALVGASEGSCAGITPDTKAGSSCLAADTKHRHNDSSTSNGSKHAASHYQHVSDSYEAAFFYSSEDYRDFVISHILRHFGLPAVQGAAVAGCTSASQVSKQSVSHTTSSQGGAAAQCPHHAPTQQLIADIGAGTGNFTQALAEAAAVQDKVLCVEPSAEMLAKAAKHPNIRPLLMDAVAFAQLPADQMRYSHALLKEVIHHIPQPLLAGMLQGMARQLLPGGVVVVVTRPQHVDYPMFKRAKEIWAEQQPHHSLYTAAMEAAGLEVEVAVAEYYTTLGLSRWLNMMKSKFWSTFSLCTEEELLQGIAEVAEQHAGKDDVEFVDRLLMVVGRKPADMIDTSADLAVRIGSTHGKEAQAR